jgi:UDP-N-acetylmuramate dehydrogenase
LQLPDFLLTQILIIMFTFRENVSLFPYNTFHMDVMAKYFSEITEIEDILEAIETGQLEKLSENGLLIIGGASNLLLTRNFTGLILRIGNKGIEATADADESVLVRVSAGENWHEFVLWCVEHGYGGLENLSLIPGNVGSCPIQNIGAYGVEVKDTFYSLEAIDLKTGELKEFTLDDCHFGYRDSVFKTELRGKYLIWSVTFKLRLNPVVNLEYGAIKQELSVMGIQNPGISDVSKAVCNIRKSKLPDPEVIGNSGSFFKNPTVGLKFAETLKETFPNLVSYSLGNQEVKLAAGWLIEQCGWKGFREGDAGVHQSQALVLVNYGNAKGSEILTLAHRIQNSVYERFGVKLEMEVNVV